ncbi:MAG: SH3 domain-containing protein [Proteobacteria bacterium]|nr:SH3 domain-containing protein [Pseudomonadota bacterium]
MRMRWLLVVLLCFAAPPRAADNTPAIPPGGVIGVTDAQLSPDFWIERAASPDAVLMTRTAVDAQNAKVLHRDPSMHEIAELPSKLGADRVKGWITMLSERPQEPLYDVHGNEIPAAALDAWQQDLALDAVPTSQPTRYGLIVHRADLRTFPTTTRVFDERGDTDIDRFQESGIFPGTPVVIAHQSRDGQWLFVVSPRYAAWVQRDAVAAGGKKDVFDYVDAKPYRVVTGAHAHTVFTREQPKVSQLDLDMGVRVPLATDLPADQPVNGQTAYTSYTIELPIRNDDGSLKIVPALLQRNADSAADYLPLTRANIIRQAFKFLGERYGWGHAYDGRDCSGFVSDVYRSMGVLMPRNTRDQGVSPGLDHVSFDDDSSHDERMRAVATLDVGDLVYIPGHVMMVIGSYGGLHYVIHDTGGIRYYGADGAEHEVKLNAVSVTPLEPLMFNDKQSYIDRMTSIVHAHPGAVTP